MPSWLSSLAKSLCNAISATLFSARREAVHQADLAVQSLGPMPSCALAARSALLTLYRSDPQPDARGMGRQEPFSSVPMKCAGPMPENLEGRSLQYSMLAPHAAATCLPAWILRCVAHRTGWPALSPAPQSRRRRWASSPCSRWSGWGPVDGSEECTCSTPGTIRLDGPWNACR
jgi:hypothetical protein